MGCHNYTKINLTNFWQSLCPQNHIQQEGKTRPKDLLLSSTSSNACNIYGAQLSSLFIYCSIRLFVEWRTSAHIAVCLCKLDHQFYINVWLHLTITLKHSTILVQFCKLYCKQSLQAFWWCHWKKSAKLMWYYQNTNINNLSICSFIELTCATILIKIGHNKSAKLLLSNGVYSYMTGLWNAHFWVNKRKDCYKLLSLPIYHSILGGVKQHG